jgi:hypothetical protein
MRAVRLDPKWRYWAAAALLLNAKLVAWTFLSPPTTGSIAARDARSPAAPARVPTRA